jgi:hypothetical protein
MVEGSVALTKTIEGSINTKKQDTITVKNAVEKEKNSIEEKLQNEQRYAFSRLFKNLRKPEKTVVTIEYKNGLILREIQVDITQEIKIPLGNLKKYFDGKETVTLHSVSKSVITDPAEYIRDTDLAIEYGVKAKKTINFDKLIKQVSGI